MHTILCLDLGIKTGWASRNAQGITASGTKLLQGTRFDGGGMRYHIFRNWIQATHNKCPINFIFYESVRAHKGTDAAHTYGGFMGQLTSWCEAHSVPYLGVPVGTIKKHATGKGNANKQAVIDAVIAFGHSPKDDNEADALALLHYVLDTCDIDA